MRGGHVDAISRRVVAGWAADPDKPGQRLTVVIAVNGIKLGEVVADRLRNDLASLGRYGDGRHGFSFSFPESLATDTDQVVTVAYKDDGARLPNGEQRIAAGAQIATPAVTRPPPAAGAPAAAQPAPPAKPAAKIDAAAPAKPMPAKPSGVAAASPASATTAPGPAPGLVPILVTAPGRSGTTLLMGLLARSPAIVAAELVPYELRLISYHAAAYNVLTSPADLEHSTHPDRLEGDGFHIGFNPFHSPQYTQAFRSPGPVREYFDGFVQDQSAAYARGLIDEFYRRLAQDRGKTAVKFLAEKGNNLHKPTRLFARRAFGAVRELVIVRDPRDVLCSHMAYFSSSAEKAFTQLSHAARQLLSIRAEGRDDIHWLKYESMVRGEAACFDGLSAFLGTAIEPEPGDAGAAVFRRHATSLTPEASVARWRTHLPPELRDRCATDWGDFLTEFGYEVR
jgi:hypothetical protein